MMRALPVLEPSREALELCVYCPKLCRAACPVSNAEPRETLIPWGKMSTAYFLARGDVPLDREHAATAWACTGCMACRERCDHRNDVAGTLGRARAALYAKGLAPAGAREVVEGFSEHLAREADAAARVRERLGALSTTSSSAPALLLGCGYAEGLDDEALSAARAAARLLGRPVRVLSSCTGLPLLEAGDSDGFGAAMRAFSRELAGADLVTADPDVAFLLGQVSAELGFGTRATLLVELAARSLWRLVPLAEAPAGPVRFHDPCKLGRGLGLYDEPRSVLARILGRAPDEFAERREQSACSGGGGLLPQTMPETASTITRARLDAHQASGGGEIVTACAGALKAFRAGGARAIDLATLIDRALPG